MTTTTVAVRPYSPLDQDACRNLWVELTQWHRDLYGAPEIGGDDPGRQFDDHLRRVGPSNLWVAVEGDRVVGLTGLIPGQEEAEIEPVIVAADRRGTGIGRRLVTTAIQAAREQGINHLCARPVARNTQALRFFRALGLDVVGHVELFTKLSPASHREWPEGPRLGDETFRH